MTNRDVKTLAIESYTRGEIDRKKVHKIAKLLSRPYLRIYLKELKNIEAKKTVRVMVPDKKMVGADTLKKLMHSFPKKRVVLEEDPQLILGVKIIDNDLIYQLNLKNSLESLSQHLAEQYD